MDPSKLLVQFLEQTVALKRERVLDFAVRRKTREKFLALLHHQLGEVFDPGCVVKTLPESAWSQPARRFHPPNVFGEEAATLRRAHEGPGDSELVITSDGRFGFWRDEFRSDAVLVQATSTKRPATRSSPR